ncbi:MAG: creatininase family protein [Acidimicrobiia bacterium]|nr:creatininase family protein [Acidimicrobiia bacterium]
MSSNSISNLTSPEVAGRIGRSATAVMPFGSIEQHGPHLPNGTDTIAAELIAEAVAGQMGALYVPFGPYGVTPIHAGHPGTVNLRRSTFEALLTDICEELVAMGVRYFVYVNWHEGNIASMDGVATELQDRHTGVFVATAHACYTAQRVYAARGGELTHGGGIEVLAVMARDPALVHASRAGEATRPDHAVALDEMRRSREAYGYITDVTEIDADGWYGNPAWATSELAHEFAGTIAAEVVKQVQPVFDLRSR